VGITENGRTRRVSAMLVSSNYFSTLGAPPVIGRGFTDDEEDPRSGAAVAVVNYGYWRQQGLALDVIGRRLVLNGRDVTIVGVAPEWFHGTMPVMTSDVWLPLGAAAFLAHEGEASPVNAIRNERSAFSLLVLGTLKPGVTSSDAAARLAPLADALAATHPDSNKDQRLVVQPRSRTARGPRPRSDAGAAGGAAVLMVIRSSSRSRLCSWRR
jgi:hypothetical protein